MTLSRRSLLLASAMALALPRALRAAEPARTGQDRDDLVGKLTYIMTTEATILHDVARERDLGILELSAANPGVDPWIPGPERLITLPTEYILPDAPREGIVVNLAELRLFFYPPGGAPVETHPIGIGREGLETPIGSTKIVRKAENPTWYPTEGKRQQDPTLPASVPPGPDNPLGAHALYLGWPTYLMHGTHKPYGVGRRVSRGCMRMYPEDVADLFGKVKVGTRVTTVNQPVKLGWRGGELFIEAHPDLAQLDELETTYGFTLKPAPDMRDAIVAAAGTEAPRIAWDVVEAELVTRRGYPVQITVPLAPGVAEVPAPPAEPGTLALSEPTPEVARPAPVALERSAPAVEFAPEPVPLGDRAPKAPSGLY
ncbi:MAG: L,D-transpeptidase family protein [Geminicoccaceae bacterium]